MTRDRDFALRPLHGTSAEATAALIRLAFAHQEAATDPPPSALGETAAAVAAVVGAHGGFGAWRGATLAGCVLWQRQDDALYLSRLAVHPAARGLGIARALVAAVAGQAQALGVARVTLSTRLVLAGNRGLFAACGFRETQQHAHPGYTHPTFVDMEKQVA